MSDSYRGIVRGKIVEFEGAVVLPEGTRVSITPEEPVSGIGSLNNWLLEARKHRAWLPRTSDSAEILRQIRQERVDR